LSNHDGKAVGTGSRNGQRDKETEGRSELVTKGKRCDGENGGTGEKGQKKERLPFKKASP